MTKVGVIETCSTSAHLRYTYQLKTSSIIQVLFIRTPLFFPRRACLVASGCSSCCHQQSQTPRSSCGHSHYNGRYVRGLLREVCQKNLFAFSFKSSFFTAIHHSYLRLFGEFAPKTVENFCTHSRAGYFDGLIFHRVIKNFMSDLCFFLFVYGCVLRSLHFVSVNSSIARCCCVSHLCDLQDSNW